MSREMGAYANLLNADRQAFIKAMLTKRGESGSTLTVICGQATPSCSAFFQQGRCPMTEAGWTRNAPTKEGWYWWQRTENDNPVVVWVNAFHPDKQLRAEMISGRRELLTHFNGLFKGPITPDSYQQGRVEGLREAVLAMETYAVRSYAIAHVMASVAELEREARAAQIEERE